jgi:putative AlgH/UPF0301 family transcriptional regulator
MDVRIESRTFQLEACQDAAGLNVTVRVENCDGSWSTAPISPVPFKRVAPQLEFLLGKSCESVGQIEAELHAGRWVLVETRCAKKYLVKAGFVEQ